MNKPTLNKTTRVNDIKELKEKELDILVIGGGITGAGIALDAASRGFNTGLVEAQDFSAGTSSRSSKMLHGGLRYLMRLDFHLVREALTERDLLLSKIAPHIAKPLPFLFPLVKRGWKKPPKSDKISMQTFTDWVQALANIFWPRAIMTMGIGMYDVMSKVGGNKKALPIQKHYTKSGMQKVFPDVNTELMSGGIRYYDSLIDDARLTINVLRTAKQYGAKILSRTQVISVIKDNKGAAKGVTVKDLETNKNFNIKAKRIISATGVWTEKIQHLATEKGGLKVLSSKGVHIIIPKDKIDGKIGIATMTEKSILFVIPWLDYWIVGTTDTKWDENPKHPVPTNEDIEYILEHLNGIITKKITKKDIVGTFAGLRPLLQPELKEGTSSAKVSREHTVATIAPNFVSIGGGKLTTYRTMARDAVNVSIGPLKEKYHSITHNIPLVGAKNYDSYAKDKENICKKNNISIDTFDHLINRYGTEIDEIFKLINKDKTLKEKIKGCDKYIKAEIVYACQNEMALHLEDCLMIRTRLIYEAADSGLSSVNDIANIMAKTLKWTAAKKNAEIKSYKNRVAAYKESLKTNNDKDGVGKRNKAKDIVPTTSVF